MKKKGFTLIELLVVVAIIAMLLAILMPALNKVKKIAQRVVCGTNLKGLGNAQVVYSNDYDGQYVCQGAGAGHTWADGTQGWQNPGKDWNVGQPITVGASLYLLVRQADVSPKSFVCPSSDQKEFSGTNTNNFDITELWDFGGGGSPNGETVSTSVSYSYQQPYRPTGANNGMFGRYRADDQRSAAFAIMADKSPYYDPKLPLAENSTTYTPQAIMEMVGKIADHWQPSGSKVDSRAGSERQRVMVGNAQPHEREGQNVLFADGHNSFEKSPDVGVKNDNIYNRADFTNANAAFWRQGSMHPWSPDRSGADEEPSSLEDSLLVNDFAGTVR
jgi:prepilin-type N-terminal cleavage/methylation domain-containing protein